MANGIRTGDHRGFNKGRSSKFRVGSWVRQTPEEGWMTYRPKRCENNNKDEDNSLKTLNDKNSKILFRINLRDWKFKFMLLNSCQTNELNWIPLLLKILNHPLWFPHYQIFCLFKYLRAVPFYWIIPIEVIGIIDVFHF